MLSLFTPITYEFNYR